MNPGSVGTSLVVAAPLRVEALALRRGAAGLRVVRTGMGPARARRAAQTLAEDAASALAIAGVCGALDASLVPGDVFVADALLGPDGSLVRRIDAQPLCAALAARGIAAQVGALIGVEKLARGYDRAALLALGARAVDMESPWLAAGAGDRPLAVLRVVSDGPGHELWSPGIVKNGLVALRSLRDAAPALADWAARLSHPAAVTAAQRG
jgi:4-hydroxy-3-methylbut-2-enyl diphosphate reductase